MTDALSRVEIKSFLQHYGVPAEDVPPVSIFAEVPPAPNTRYRNKKLNRDHWSGKLWNIVESTTSKFGIRLVLTEIAIIKDRRMIADESNYFVSNIVCRDLDVENEKATILAAYLSAINAISRIGSTLNTLEFHDLHHVYVAGKTKNDVDDVEKEKKWHYSWFRRLVEIVSPEESGYVNPTGGIDFEGHHRKFFDIFLDKLRMHDKVLFTEGLHYIAIPFRRPASTDFSIEDTCNPSLQLEPAGAVFVIFLAPQGVTNINVNEFASTIHNLCNIACLRESSNQVDLSFQRDRQQRALLAAYDSIGHTLRTFVEATGYRGASNALLRVQQDTRLPDDLKKYVADARKCLSFFEHAESLGSLLRLQGWVGHLGSGEDVQRQKILRCYQLDQVEGVREHGSFGGSSLIMGLAQLVETIVWPLAQKDGVAFRVTYRGDGGDVISVKIDRFREDVGKRRVATIPPLKDIGDEAAVKLSIMVALLEPLRNAATHVKVAGASASVEIMLERLPNGVVSAYIGNKVVGPFPSRQDVIEGNSGISLIRHILYACRLGEIRSANDGEIRRLCEAMNLQESGPAYFWLCVEVTPLRLFDYVNEKLTGSP